MTLSNSMNIFPNIIYLVTHSTMQGLCLDNNEREETMNGYFLNTADSAIVQTGFAPFYSFAKQLLLPK